jgi:hypothetical protein
VATFNILLAKFRRATAQPANALVYWTRERLSEKKTVEELGAGKSIPSRQRKRASHRQLCNAQLFDYKLADLYGIDLCMFGPRPFDCQPPNRQSADRNCTQRNGTDCGTANGNRAYG